MASRRRRLFCAASLGALALHGAACFAIGWSPLAPDERTSGHRGASRAGSAGRAGCVTPQLVGGALPPASGERAACLQAGSLAAGAAVDTAAFELAAKANEVVGAALSGGLSPATVVLLFVAGIASSINPCSAATLPAAAAAVTAVASSRAGVFAQAAAFATGSATVLATLGLTASTVGSKILIEGSGLLQWVFPMVAMTMGLSLLGVISMRLPGSSGPPKLPEGIPRELQGFCLGALDAAGASPCATPVLVTVISYLASHPELEVTGSAVLLLSYAMGYSTPLAVVSIASAGVALPWLMSAGRLGPRVAGGFILAVGVSQLLSRVETVFGLSLPAGPLSEPQLGLGFLLLALGAGATALPVLVSDAGESLVAEDDLASVAAPKVVPVEGDVGVYRYSPSAPAADVAAESNSRASVSEAASSGSVVGQADVDDASRRLSLASMLAGIAGCEVSRGDLFSVPAPGQASETPQQMIQRMADRSRPLAVALRSGRPVLVDFSATWCVDCVKMAPLMLELEETYGKEVEFVTVDASGTKPELSAAAVPLDLPFWLQEFRVDGIPHFAFIDSKNNVMTALIGNIPGEVMRANLDALKSREAELPYTMYDAFEEGRRILRFPQ
eukprot:TRINITY_DN51695_c0_g1_i1.p1 TRINITY_DN51695_c0_g1~~TRINITY_DN51695_c0_g1_i1.p1  ORF type:complete len:617 (+),score=124.73 TRINITY_DN51695_c0_g1_i1:89-1939(+)